MSTLEVNTFKTFCISLKKSVDRRSHMLSIKDKIGIDFEFYDAIPADEITEEIEYKYFRNTDFYEWDINQKAVMATFMSHMHLLEYGYKHKTNLLIIEDDIDYVGNLDFGNIDFSSFDIFNVGTPFGCHAYFVSYEGAYRILNELNSTIITQAYDWELYKLKTVRKLTTEVPQFIQVENKFTSSIAPNGYKKHYE